MIALIDYNMGNLGSVLKALAHLGAEVQVVENGANLQEFDGCLLPGVGNFGDGMAQLEARGFVEPIKAFVASGKPFMGICLGMQMLLDSSEEAEGVAGLGIISGDVVHFPTDSGEKIPHMGWNEVRCVNDNFGSTTVNDGDFFYFVHSFYAKVKNPEHAILECNYILPFTAAVGFENVFASQFHPEKSQDNGMALLRNFVERCAK